MYLSKVRVALLYYRYYCVIPALLAIPGCWLYALDGFALPVILMKLATDCLVWYFVSSTGANKFYYFYNLHVSKTFLFITWLLADLLIFCSLLWLTTLIS